MTTDCHRSEYSVTTAPRCRRAAAAATRGQSGRSANDGIFGNRQHNQSAAPLLVFAGAGPLSLLERIPRSANLLVQMMDMAAPFPVEIVRRVLQLDPTLRMQTDWAKLLPIHKAAAKLQDWGESSGLELLRVLLERDADAQLCTRSRHGDTPLDVLAKNGKCRPGAAAAVFGLALRFSGRVGRPRHCTSHPVGLRDTVAGRLSRTRRPIGVG